MKSLILSFLNTLCCCIYASGQINSGSDLTNLYGDIIEPYNDPYNPDVMASFNAVYQARQVYQLLGTPGRISMVIHGDGHETVDDAREYAYNWFDRYFKKMTFYIKNKNENR